MSDLGSGKRRVWVLAGLLIAALFVVESIAVHHLYTTRFPGANDFYAPWAGARALLLEGRDPYGQDVTAEIQIVKGIDPTLRGEGKGGFAYPLPIIFTFWPLVYFPYAWVQAIWMVTLQWVIMATVVVLLRLQDWVPGPLGLVGLFIGTLFLYPVARSVMLGQFTLHVTLFLAIALLAINYHRDAWAGAALALTSIKPQMVILVAPWIVLWAVSRRRWRLLGGLLATGALLMVASLALFPRWPVSFAGSVMRYSAVAGGRNPIEVLVGLFWSEGSVIVRYGLSAGLVTAMLGAWRWGWGDTGEGFARATHWTIVVSLLVPFQTGTTNQAMLLIPLFAWLSTMLERRDAWIVLTSAGVLELALWILFLATIQGNWENPVMFLPLPFLGLIRLVGIELSNLCQSRRSRIPAEADETQ